VDNGADVMPATVDRTDNGDPIDLKASRNRCASGADRVSTSSDSDSRGAMKAPSVPFARIPWKTSIGMQRSVGASAHGPALSGIASFIFSPPCKRMRAASLEESRDV
jgi:hypothetical protein